MSHEYRMLKARIRAKDDARANTPGAALDAALNAIHQQKLKMSIESLERALTQIRDNSIAPHAALGTAHAAIEYVLQYLKTEKALRDGEST